MTQSFVLALLVACGESVQGPVGVEEAPVAKPPPAPEAAVVDDGYYYDPATKRDPFRDFVRRATGDAPSDTPPLLRYNVDKFVLTGVVWGTSSPLALLIDPDGLGHPVQVGDQVGRNFGKVTAITEKSVTVTEEYQTPDGQVVVNPVEVRLAAREGKKR